MTFAVEVDKGRAVIFVEEPEWSQDSDPRKVAKWSKTFGTLRKSQRGKVYKLCDYNCLQYLGDNVFVCLPLDTHSEIEYKGKVFRKTPFLRDFNEDPTPYEIRKLWGDQFECTCQWNQVMHLNCSHISALKLEFKRKKFGGNNP